MSDRPLVVMTDYLSEASCEDRVLEGVADVMLLGAREDSTVVERAAHADALLVFHDIKITARSIDRLDRCKGIVRVGVGFDNVDLAAAGRRGIVVCNVPDYGTEEVADHALMQILALARRLMSAHQAIRAGNWDPLMVAGTPRLRGRNLGLIGCGRIGAATALRAKAIGMRVVIFDPYKPDGYEKSLGVERCERLDELLPQAEFVSLHCPLSQETRHILNAKTLAQLPRGAYVINTARGPCIDGDALLAALDSGQVSFAALDVVEREPLDDERIRRHPNILLTPHSAFYSDEGFVEMRTKAAREVRRMLTGVTVRNPVNLHCLTAPRCLVPSPLPIDA